ncbi:M23 family metallopeptidase [Helicobacter sp. 13S00477-4]|uniref:M23 family metallopeptidase n=1 Tax=Helicobacter sp. 13S00477-4 TaxID=1905759 RepID=UPI000BA6EC52|nr:M23 family metallopeptidase [Helicobacter sp. 13S00477-4]PAF51039.1 hypothetical protein BKH44_06495 [Helicobacter sp. 13S00477-4]
MHDKLVITIVDESGSKQFRLPKNIKKVIVFCCTFIMIVILSSFLLMKFLMQKIDQIALNKNIALSEYKFIYQKNNRLKDQIKQKTDELTIVSQKIDDLENIVDLKKNANKQTSNENTINLQDVSNSQKILILTLIPSGDPITSYTSKTSTSMRPHPTKRVKGIPAGYDFATNEGTPVYATADGVIDIVRNQSNSGYGNLVKITHSFGFSSVYAHLEKSVVKKGNFVQKGQVIGYSGHTGNSNGNTLYYEVRFLGKILNPAIYTAWNSDNFEEVFKNDPSIDWKTLVWAIGDIARLQNYKLSQASELPRYEQQ